MLNFLLCYCNRTGMVHRIHEPILRFHVFGHELDGLQSEMMNAVVILKLCEDGQQLIDHADIFHLILGRYTDEPMIIASRLEHSSFVEFDRPFEHIDLMGNRNVFWALVCLAALPVI